LPLALSARPIFLMNSLPFCGKRFPRFSLSRAEFRHRGTFFLRFPPLYRSISRFFSLLQSFFFFDVEGGFLCRRDFARRGVASLSVGQAPPLFFLSPFCNYPGRIGVRGMGLLPLKFLPKVILHFLSPARLLVVCPEIPSPGHRKKRVLPSVPHQIPPFSALVLQSSF